MFTIKLDSNYKFDYNNFIFSTSFSRPSKSLIDCNLYKQFYKINLDLNVFNIINTQNIENHLIKELLCILKLNMLDIDTLSISFDTIIINVINDESNLIFNFDKNVNIKSITQNFIEILNEIENNDSVIFNFCDLYYYPSCELLIIISGLFDKIKVYYSKLIKQNII